MVYGFCPLVNNKQRYATIKESKSKNQIIRRLY